MARWVSRGRRQFVGQPAQFCFMRRLAQATLNPSSLATQQGALTQYQSLAQTVSNLSSSIAGLQQDADEQIGTTVTQANTLIQQIYTLNPQNPASRHVWRHGERFA